MRRGCSARVKLKQRSRQWTKHVPALELFQTESIAVF
jgi:hypothetical protein